MEMFVQVMYCARSKTFKLGIVNSLMCAAIKKVVVRQVKTATCNGEVRSKCSLIAMMVARMYGSLMGYLDMGLGCGQDQVACSFVEELCLPFICVPA